jgi:hypothetical protein
LTEVLAFLKEQKILRRLSLKSSCRFFSKERGWMTMKLHVANIIVGVFAASSMVCTQANAGSCATRWVIPHGSHLEIQQSNSWKVTCNLKQSKTGGALHGATNSACNASEPHGAHMTSSFFQGSIKGDTIKFRIQWLKGPEGDYSASIDGNGRIHNGTSTDKTNDNAPKATWTASPNLICSQS